MPWWHFAHFCADGNPGRSVPAATGSSPPAEAVDPGAGPPPPVPGCSGGGGLAASSAHAAKAPKSGAAITKREHLLRVSRWFIGSSWGLRARDGAVLALGEHDGELDELLDVLLGLEVQGVVGVAITLVERREPQYVVAIAAGGFGALVGD